MTVKQIMSREKSNSEEIHAKMVDKLQNIIDIPTISLFMVKARCHTRLTLPHNPQAFVVI